MSNPLRAAPRYNFKKEPKRENGRGIPARPMANGPVNLEDPNDYETYELRLPTQKELDGVRTHVLKLHSKQVVDPATEFTKPIRLHRKETKNLQYQLTRAEIEQRQKELQERKYQEEQGLVKSEYEFKDEDDEDHRMLTEEELRKVAPETKSEEQKRLEKQEKLLAQIAPDGGARKRNAFKKKTRQLKAVDETAKRLRYEEYYPWVLEDYDGKNTWVGNYEAAQSDAFVLLELDEANKQFKLIPAEKVYKFTPRNKYSTLTLEEAEARMEKKASLPRWLMKRLDPEEQKLTRYERTQKKLKTVVGTGNNQNDRGDRDSDNDDLDFEEDFADDEEAPLMEGDEEENKENERRMKKEMRAANAMGLRDDENADEEIDDLFETRKVDNAGAKLRKALIKTDITGMYESDDDEESNPYLSKSDLEQDEDVDDDIETLPTKLPDLKASPSKLQNPGSKSPTPGVKTIQVKSVNNPVGYVVFKALPSFLVKFPKGEWNPNVKKREGVKLVNERESKRVKLEMEPNSPGSPRNPSLSPQPQPQSRPSSPVTVKAEPGTEADSSSALLDSKLLTEQDIISIVTSEKVTPKDLILRLKVKLSQHPDNRNRIKTLAKKLCRNEGGYLVLK